MHPLLSLLIGIACAGVGGDLFVRGTVGVATWLRIPPGIVGATIAAFATSSPELSVSINAARAGVPQIALGDALGSNVVNIGLVLALALLFAPIKASEGSLKRDFPVALFAPILTALMLMDGVLSRWDGITLLTLFAGWILLSAIETRKARDATQRVLGEKNRVSAALAGLFGLGLLIVAGQFIVTGGKWVGESLGWSPFVVGAIIVAIGTSVPELATTIISRLRGHDEIGLGTIIGSNIFNGMFIISIAAIIHPIEVNLRNVLLGLAFGVAMVLIAVPRKGGIVPRRRGAILLTLYAVYLVVMAGL